VCAGNLKQTTGITVPIFGESETDTKINHVSPMYLYVPIFGKSETDTGITVRIFRFPKLTLEFRIK